MDINLVNILVLVTYMDYAIMIC